MSGFRVLVASKSQAQLYALPTRRSSLKALQAFVNPAAQQPERALGTSRPGRTSGVGGARHAYQAKHGLKESAEEAFVRFVTSALVADADATGDAPIVLVAAPRLLGRYRRHLPASVRARVVAEIPLDLCKLPAIELSRRVRTAVLDMAPSARAAWRTKHRKDKKGPKR